MIVQLCLDFLSGPSLYPPGVMQGLPPLTATDSGFYSSGHPGSALASFTSLSSVDTDPGSGRLVRRRLSSNADIPDYGSWCSLQRRWRSSMESCLTPGDHQSSPLPGPPNIDSLNLKCSKTSALLGLAVIISTPDDHSQHQFLKQNLVIENIFAQLSQCVRQAYIHKRKFVSTIHSGYLECSR